MGKIKTCFFVFIFSFFLINNVLALNDASLKINVNYFANYNPPGATKLADMTNDIYIGSEKFGTGNVEIPLTSSGLPIEDTVVSDNVPGLSVIRGKDDDGTYVDISAYGFNHQDSRESIKFDIEFENSAVTNVVNDRQDLKFGYEKPLSDGCGIHERYPRFSNPDNDEIGLGVGENEGSFCSTTNIVRDRVKVYYDLVLCDEDSDCGEDGWVGEPYCQDDDVWQDYKEFTCNNPGTINSYCSDISEPRLKEECAYGCANGSCIPPDCTLDDDNDGVNNCDDKCPDTILPEVFVRLGTNRYGEIDGDKIFETKRRGEIIDSNYTISMTYGCSCKQILEIKPGNNKGEVRYGCTKGTMDNFIRRRGWFRKFFR